ncbi:uncharacterized protein N7496_002295 [Penicillium cataractarum]|uniref:NACHT domain-containing protein n=1 Tax=Penicillium cataractarum TaxID=2100454 RepID=A0A9W9SJY9_9EURO|nr:uncharacterized protein N7496_002295 [Penicillium cataractarum]KAJ5379867.1 hypothetical protein N7496_002295 [Penicillium cataractarum]
MSSKSSLFFHRRSQNSPRLLAQPSSTDLWEHALALYVKDLDPLKQQQFQAPTTVEECLEGIVLNGQKRRSFTRILEFLRPLVDPLKRFEGAIDVVVQVNAGIASPIWGPLRVAITIASQHLATLETLVIIVDKIAHSVQRYENLKTLFAEHDGVRDAIGRLYCELLRLCACVSKYETSRIRYISNPFGKEFDAVSTAIDQRALNVDRAAQAAHFQESKDAREMLLAETQEQDVRRIQCWLAPACVEDDLQRRVSEYLQGSGDWILQAEGFKKWYTSAWGDSSTGTDGSPTDVASHSMLQVIGRPGSGKSILAAYLVNHLSQSGRVVYFFFNKQDSERNMMIHAARTTIAQLLNLYPDITEIIMPVYKQSGRVVADSLTDVMKMLKQVLDQLSSRADGQSHCIVLDGIDECEDWVASNSHLLGSLPNNGSVKIVLFSRVALASLSSDVPSDPLIVTMESNQNVEIRAYAEGRIRKMVHLATTDLGLRVVSKTTEQADGLWLYARLVLDEIERAPSREVVESSLDSLPSGLEELYNHILCTKEAKMSDAEKLFARYLFLCADISNYMPDFLAQTTDSIQQGMLDLVFRFANGGNMPFDVPKLAEKLGAPLIEVLRPTEHTYELRFVHLSVYQYLADSTGPAKNGRIPELIQTRQVRGLHRGAVAVWYFTKCLDSELHLHALQSDYSEPSPDHWSECYFPMAYCLWDALKIRESHLQHLPTPLLEEAENTLDTLTAFLRTQLCLRWFELSTIINYAGDFPQLLDRVSEAFEIARSEQNNSRGLRAYDRFNRARLSFLGDWQLIVLQTTPWKVPIGKSTCHFQDIDCPGFLNDVPGQIMLHTAERWSAKFMMFSKAQGYGKAPHDRMSEKEVTLKI